MTASSHVPSNLLFIYHSNFKDRTHNEKIIYTTINSTSEYRTEEIAYMYRNKTIATVYVLLVILCTNKYLHTSRYFLTDTAKIIPLYQ